MRLVVLAGTHAPRRWRACPPRVAGHLRRADLILHAGDVCVASVLAELAQYAPVAAVLGNNDAPDVVDWGAAGLRIFNPGSPTDRRRQTHGTIGLLQIDSGRLARAAIVPVT